MHLAVFVDNKLMDETGANIRLLNFQLKIEKTSYLHSAASSAGQVKLQWGQAARHIRNATSNLTASSPCIWYEQETVCLSFSLSRLHSLHAAVHACVCVCVCLQQPRRPIMYPDALQLRAALLCTADRASLSSVPISGRHPAIWLRWHVSCGLRNDANESDISVQLLAGPETQRVHAHTCTGGA